MTGISVQVAALSNGYAAAKTIFEITEESRPSIHSGQEDNIILDDVQGSIKLHDVDFSYPARPDVRIYSHVTLEIPAGKTTAIIGASGCGKSMLCIFPQTLLLFTAPCHHRNKADEKQFIQVQLLPCLSAGMT